MPEYINSILYYSGAVIAGAVFTYLLLQYRVNRLQEQKRVLETRLEMELQHAEQRLATMEKARQQLSESFAALSSQALKHNSEEFLKLAQQNLQKFQTEAKGQLEQKEKSIEHLIKPIQEALHKTEKQIHEIEKDRKESFGALHKHLESMAQAQNQLHEQTNKLVNALRRPEVRGQWGEMTLRRLAELAGMVEHCDFYEQQQVKTDEGALRPDMIVRMPDGREIVVDVKTPLDAYLEAIEAHDDATRQTALVKHARNVRNRVNELADKRYWAQFKNTPDFVVLFIPGDQFLTAALDQEPQLLEDALARQVILATPTSLVALLRAVAYGWRQEQLAENAEHIKAVGEELYTRLVTFSDHLQKLGRSLDSSVKHYNKAVGSFDSRVLSGARRFQEMGISAEQKFEEIPQLETAPRQVENADSDD